MTANPDPLSQTCTCMIGQKASRSKPNFGTCRSHPRAGHAQLMNPQSLHLSLPNTHRNFLVSPSFASSTHNSDDIHTDKGRARDEHSRGEALFCPFFTTTGLFNAGAMPWSLRISVTGDCEQAHAGFVPSRRRPCAWPCDDLGSRKADEKPRLRSDRHGVEGDGMRCVGMPHHVADRHVK